MSNPSVFYRRFLSQGRHTKFFHSSFFTTKGPKKNFVCQFFVLRFVEKTEGTEGHTKFSQPGLRGEARFRHEAKALKTLCANFFVCRFLWQRKGAPRVNRALEHEVPATDFVAVGFHMPTSSPASFWQRGKTPRGKIRRSSKRKSLLKGPQNA